MKQTINFSDFCDAFHTYDRDNQFSYEGKEVIFEYLEQYEEDSGQEIELDVIAICCDYYEDDLETVINEYSIDVEDCEDNDDKLELVREYLNDNTMLLGETSSGFVYQAF